MRVIERTSPTNERIARARDWLATTLAPPAPERKKPAVPVFTPRFVALLIVGVLAAMIWRALQHYPTGVFDFYPLYYGGKAWLHGHNAYVLDAVAPAQDVTYQLFRIGNIYPLPAVLATLPLSFLPPQAAGTAWIGLLMAGLLIGLRLNGWPHSAWYLLYVPFIEGIRIEQFTAFIVVVQLFALWALRERRPWLLALCGALILMKPNHGFFFVVALLLIGRHWRQQAVVGAIIWGGSFLLDPNWVFEWIPQLVNHNATLHQPFLWPLALFALPLLLFGETIAAASVFQFAMMPYAGVYNASTLALPFLGDRRVHWLSLLSFLWMFAALIIGQPWALLLTLILPITGLAYLRWRARRAKEPRPELPRALAAEPTA